MTKHNAEHLRQHFLTESYLKGFVDRDYEGFVIWQYRKSKGEIRPLFTKEAATGEYLYSIVQSVIQSDSHYLEKQFAEVEKHLTPFARKVLQYIEAFNLGVEPRYPFTPADRIHIIEFFVVHMIRVPSVRDWIGEKAEQHHEQMRAKDLLRFGETRSHNTGVQAMAWIYGDMRIQAVDFLRSRNAMIEYSVRAKNTVFTCDNPVIRLPPGAGMAHETTEVLFPLNRRSFIRFHGRGNELALVKNHGSERIDWFNKLVIESATDEIYASDAQQLLKTLNELGRSASIIEETTRKYRKRE